MRWNMVSETKSFPEVGIPFEFIGFGGSLNYGVIKSPATVENPVRIETGTSSKPPYTGSILCWRYLDLPESVINYVKTDKRMGIQFGTVYRHC